jgi:hypothetical protein
MPKIHATALVEAEGVFFQALCLCGWVSSVSFLEETDLIRALHAHEGVYENRTAKMSVAVDKLRELGMDLDSDPEREER